ncbi:replication initiator [Saccharopolyspora sp. NPDC047091]|uniref:replication initiator n=1 Tax=Saccharopolyspora sp. NPDC047091 TaxID=3155924 RepID=UPI003407C0F2
MTATVDTRALVGSPLSEEQRFDIHARGLRGKGFRELVRSVRGCSKPVWLAGSWRVEQPGGQAAVVLDERTGGIAVSCNNRRESVCPSCAARYAGDAFQLVRAGLSGGKGVPETVEQNPRLFVTLTAPSFGPVHTRSTTPRGRVRRCRCGESHHEADSRIGGPVEPDSYDYTGAVVWNAHAGALWHRFRLALSRLIAASLGIRVTDIPATFRVSYSKVAEYQRRGLVHFHAVIRLDGPAGPHSRHPAGITTDTLADCIRTAAACSSVEVEATDTHGPVTVAWGEQVQIDPITSDPESEEGASGLGSKVAGYIAKYATKGTGATAGTDTRIRNETHIEELPVSTHHRAMIRTAWQLGYRRWAHMLGFGGHFLTKSKEYSTTFTALRGTRAEHQRAAHLDALGIADTDDVVIVNDWAFTGIGWRNQAEREIAEAVRDSHQYNRHRYAADGGDERG